MAVISELIDVGLELKAQGKREAAIEHFRQLRETYPDNARIMFELAATWNAFDVPERALPLYRALLELPKSKALPARDMPRLYARLAATHFVMRAYDEALETVDDGLRLHPSYRPLRAFRIFSRYHAGQAGSALVDALDLMLESLAPSRWDGMEDEIKAIVADLRASINSTDGALASGAESIHAQAPADKAPVEPSPVAADIEEDEPAAEKHGGDARAQADAAGQIAVSDAADPADDFELEVKVKSSSQKPDREANPKVAKASS